MPLRRGGKKTRSAPPSSLPIEQRKKENQECTKECSDLMASDPAAKEFLVAAKNRLYKFYSPKMYKSLPPRGHPVSCNLERFQRFIRDFISQF